MAHYRRPMTLDRRKRIFESNNQRLISPNLSACARIFKRMAALPTSPFNERELAKLGNRHVVSHALGRKQKRGRRGLAPARRTPLSPWSRFAAQSLGSANTVSVPPLPRRAHPSFPASAPSRCSKRAHTILSVRGDLFVVRRNGDLSKAPEVADSSALGRRRLRLS
jgi:hypothetical protein